MPWVDYIVENTNVQVFCDGICHFDGISYSDAVRCFNDPSNLAPLCSKCNSRKEGTGGEKPFCKGACPGRATCTATRI